ncbi:universal stress protein [Bacillaceae bacterium W0354]
MSKTNYKHILVGFDGSTPAKNAVQKAITFAACTQGKVTIAYIIDKQQIDLVLIGGYHNAIEDAENIAENVFEELFEELEIPENVEVVKEIRLGNPKHMIAKKLPDELNVDLIFCGATGTNAIERWILGSVSHYVINNSKYDVTIVR